MRDQNGGPRRAQGGTKSRRRLRRHQRANSASASVGITADKGGNFEARNGGPDRAWRPARSSVAGAVGRACAANQPRRQLSTNESGPGRVLRGSSLANGRSLGTGRNLGKASSPQVQLNKETDE
jgi:hypothetical protein